MSQTSTACRASALCELSEAAYFALQTADRLRAGEDQTVVLLPAFRSLVRLRDAILRINNNRNPVFHLPPQPMTHREKSVVFSVFADETPDDLNERNS